MNKLLVSLLFLFVSVSLEAGAKKIILASFNTEEKAQSMLRELPQRSPSIYALSKKYNFDLKTRKSGKYYILSAEVFYNEKTLNIVLKKTRRYFKGAYISKNVVVEKVKNKEQVKIKKVIQVVKKEKIIEKPKPIQKVEKVHMVKAVEVVKVEEKEVDINAYAKDQFLKQMDRIRVQAEPIETFVRNNFHWTYIPIFIFLVILYYYYRKFKKVYDEY